MVKLDRLGWTAGLTFEAYGLRLGVRVTDAHVLDEIRSLLPHGSVEVANGDVDFLYSYVVGGSAPGSRTRRFHLLYAGAELYGRSHDSKLVLDSLESQMQLIVAEFAKGRVFIHSGVVEVSGRAILIPGRSFSGKSTLVAELVRMGATYYSDEYAVLDADGFVYPYARDPQLRKPGEHKGTPVPLDRFGARVGTDRIPVGLVLETKFESSAEFEPQELSKGKVVLSMLANTVGARTRTEEALTAIQAVADKAKGLAGPRGEAEIAARRILEIAFRL